jgi:nucleoside-triphosphatase THEP1
MSKINKDNFVYLGGDFQIRLVAQLIVDTKFAESIIEIMDPNYFGDANLKMIVLTIKDAYQEHGVIPDMGSLEFRMLHSVTSDFEKKYTLAQLKLIKEANLNDGLTVQEKAMLFCKQQELKKSINEIKTIIDKGDFTRYNECEEILKKALEHGEQKDNGMDVLDNIDAVLIDDFRKPIATGIRGLDEIMDGGLSKGELAIILAPFGVGKTTMITKIANTGKNLGLNVLQIFFEDNPKVIQRKHLACWSGYELNDLSIHKEELKELAYRKKNEKGILKLKKFPSDGTTIPIIRQYIRKLIAQGFKPDLLLIDYIDCIQPSKNFDDVYAGEGNVMRQFETLLAEFDIAGWTAVQGNRSSIGSTVVQADQMGGSIKKGQIGHFVVSIAKTLDQKADKTATMAILKSRFGVDGIIFENIRFDNASIQIDMTDDMVGKNQSDFKKDKEIDDVKRVAMVFSEQQRQRKKALDIDGQVLAE